jgi:hypothetical protein
MWMALAGHQFPRAFGVSFGTSAAHKAPMVQEDPQQVQVRTTQVTAQREVVAQPALLHESTRRSQRTQPYLSSFDPDGDWASQLLHLVQDMDSDENFGGTTPVLAEA